MNRKSKQNLINALLLLVLRIKKEIADSKSQGKIWPNDVSYGRWEIKNFKYNEQGPSYSSASRVDFIKKKYGTDQSQKYTNLSRNLTNI